MIFFFTLVKIHIFKFMISLLLNGLGFWVHLTPIKCISLAVYSHVYIMSKNSQALCNRMIQRIQIIFNLTILKTQLGMRDLKTVEL